MTLNSGHDQQLIWMELGVSAIHVERPIRSTILIAGNSVIESTWAESPEPWDSGRALRAACLRMPIFVDADHSHGAVSWMYLLFRFVAGLSERGFGGTWMWGWPIRFGRGQISTKRLPSLAPHVSMYKMCTLEHTQEVNDESENILL